MNRRTFVAALAALPVVGRVFAEPVVEPVIVGECVNEGSDDYVWPEIADQPLTFRRCAAHVGVTIVPLTAATKAALDRTLMLECFDCYRATFWKGAVE